MRERINTEEFVARVTAPLKEGVALSAGFDARVQRAIAEAARPWWQRHRTFTLSPLGSLAMAAGLAGLALLGGLAASRVFTAPAAVVAQAPDTVHVVRFVFADASAQQVAIAGDFNGWSRSATLLEDVAGSGQWSVDLVLTPGRHEYVFIVDGERWVADPFALRQRDEFGQESSVVRVGGDVMRGA